MFPHQEPLLLYACGFDALRFRRTERAAQANETAMVSMIERDLVASAMTSAIITRMRSDDKVRAQGDSIATCLGRPLTSSAALVKVAVAGEHVAGPTARHVPLLQRPREPSVEERLKKWVVGLRAWIGIYGGPGIGGREAIRIMFAHRQEGR